MARTIVGPGAHGGVVGQVQRALIVAGCGPPGVDELYGPGMQSAVKQFQQAQQLAASGIVDDVTWAALTHQPAPEIDVRSLELTAAFEGHGYTLAMGNFDGAWLTWGIIGFTLKHGEVQKILLDVNANHPELLQQAFGEHASELLSLMQASPEEQRQWAESVTQAGRLVEPWRTGFALFGQFEAVREEQRRLAHNDYFVPCLQTAQQYGLRSELGLAFCFDIHVQNGGIHANAQEAIQQELRASPPASEKDRRVAIANAVADAAMPAYREDVRRRKLTIAQGQGTVHSHNYVLENWGLGESPAL
jgi:hypothetical protein